MYEFVMNLLYYNKYAKDKIITFIIGFKRK